MVANPKNYTAMNPDVVDVAMPASMNEYLRLMGQFLVTQDSEGEFALRHGRDFWMSFFEATFEDGGPSPELAYEHLQSVLSDWNQSMTIEGCPTPLPV